MRAAWVQLEEGRVAEAAACLRTAAAGLARKPNLALQDLADRTSHLAETVSAEGTARAADVWELVERLERLRRGRARP